MFLAALKYVATLPCEIQKIKISTLSTHFIQQQRFTFNVNEIEKLKVSMCAFS